VSTAAIALIASVDPAGLEALEARIEQRLLEKLLVSGVSPWMDVKSAADYLSWPAKRIYTLTSSKEIPHRKVGNRLLFSRDELDQWLSDHYEGPPACRP